MNKKPSTGVHEITTVSTSVVTIACHNSLNFHFTWRQKVDTGNGLVSNGHLSLDGANVKASESIEVVEDGAVRSTDSKFNSGKFREDTEHAERSLVHNHLSREWRPQNPKTP